MADEFDWKKYRDEKGKQTAPVAPVRRTVSYVEVMRQLEEEAQRNAAATVQAQVDEEYEIEPPVSPYPTAIITAAQEKSLDRTDQHFQRRIEPILGVPLPIKSRLPDLSDAAEKLKRTFPWFATANEIVMDAIALSHVSKRPPQLPNMLLVGPSGCGKTEYARMIAELFDTPLSLLPAGGSGDDCGLGATDRRWSTSMPSLPVRRILATGRADQIICIDELDKSAPLNNRNGSVQGALMQMLSSRRDYYDIFVSAPVDLSTVTFMATANDLSPLNGAVIDRFMIVECTPPTREHFDALLDSCTDRILRNLEIPEGLFSISGHDREIIRHAWLRLRSPSIRSILKIVEKIICEQARDLLEARILH